MIAQGAELYRHDGGNWDFAIGLYDEDKVSIAGFDDVGTPRVKLVSTSPPLREWGEMKVEQYREQSVLLTVDHAEE